MLLAQRWLLLWQGLAALALVTGGAGEIDSKPKANLEAQLSCEEGPVCHFQIINHRAKSHLVFLPGLLPPRALGTYPAILEIEVVDRDGKRIENQGINDECYVGVGGFRPADLQLLDVGRSIGWEIELLTGQLWRFQLSSGHYRVRGRATIRLASALAANESLRKSAQERLGPNFKDADVLLVDGIFETDWVDISIP